MHADYHDSYGNDHHDYDDIDLEAIDDDDEHDYGDIDDDPDMQGENNRGQSRSASLASLVAEGGEPVVLLASKLSGAQVVL